MSLLFMGAGYFWVASIDIVHIIAYPGMNLILEGTTNLSAQIWLAARFLEAGILLTGALVYFKSDRGYAQFFGIGILSIAITALVLSGYFPTAYVEGVGLTQFKIQSEHLIIVALTAALYFYNKSEAFKGERTKKFIAGVDYILDRRRVFIHSLCRLL